MNKRKVISGSKKRFTNQIFQVMKEKLKKFYKFKKRRKSLTESGKM